MLLWHTLYLCNLKLQFLNDKSMKPIDFAQSTKCLQRPGTMTDEECGSLHVWNDGKQCISKWRPTMWERIKILFGQDIWLGVMSGKTQPPVFLAAERVFEQPPVTTRIKNWFGKVFAVIGEKLQN